MLKVNQLTGFGAALARDPHWASVVLLLGFNGADASTTHSDESPTAKGLTSFTGNAQLDTAEKKFGNASLLLDGTGDRVAYNDSADFNLSNGLYTVEMWINPDSVTGTRFLAGQWQSAGNLGWVFNLSGSTLRMTVSTDGSSSVSDPTGGTVTTGSWQHVAADFDGSKYRLYHNGSMVGSSTTLRTYNNSTNFLSIGSNHGADSFFFDGWIDEFRLTKGVARYASDSGLIVPTAPFPRRG